MTSPPHPSEAVLLVAWYDRRQHLYYPIGRLRRRATPPIYEFAYLRGAEMATTFGFTELLAFPDLNEVYRSNDLFSFFTNRLLPRSRPDYGEFVSRLGLDPATADEMTILARSGGTRATDLIEIYPFPSAAPDGRYEAHFLVDRLHGLGESAYSRILKLKPAERLRRVDRREHPQDSLLIPLETNDGVCVGYLPEHLLEVTWFLKEAEKLGALVEVLVEQVNPPPAPLQQRILCILRSDWTSETALLFPARYQPISPQAARLELATRSVPVPAPQPSRIRRPAFITGASRVGMVLDRLLVRLRQEGLPPIPSLAAPKGGRIRIGAGDTPIVLRDSDARFELHDNDDLVLRGSDRKILTELQKSSRQDSRKVTRNRSDFELVDGSALSAELTTWTGSSTEISETSVRHSWALGLSVWSWTANKAVRYWAGRIPQSPPSGTHNLVVTTPQSSGWAGIHVPGHQEITVLALDRNAERSSVLLIESSGSLENDREMVPRLGRALGAVLGMKTPGSYFGYDEESHVVAFFSSGQSMPTVHRPGTVAAGILVPAGYRQYVKHDKVWAAALLEKLRSDLVSEDSRTLDALMHFCTVLASPYYGDHVAGLGTAIRILLRREMPLERDAMLDPEQVKRALTGFAERHGANLPPGALALVDLSHRVALLGEEEMRPAREDTNSEDAESLNWVVESADGLLATFATLVGCVIGYTGPVPAGYDPKSNEEREHWPFGTNIHEPLASTRFSAGDANDLPW